MIDKSDVLNVLNRANYVIKYDFSTKKSEGLVTVTHKNESYTIKYNAKKKEITGTLLDSPISCPPYFVPSILCSRLRQLCEHQQYPYKYLQCSIDGVPTTTPHFPFTKDAEEALQALKFAEIYTDTERYGLQQDAAAAATPEELEFILDKIFNLQAKITKK